MQFSGPPKSDFRTNQLGVWACLFLLVPQLGWAVGTPAGTIISNTAIAKYSSGGVSQPPLIAIASIKVDELIQPVLTWQDAAAVAVVSPGTNDALQFLLTNAGNGQEAFGLARTNGPLPLAVSTGRCNKLAKSFSGCFIF